MCRRCALPGKKQILACVLTTLCLLAEHMYKGRCAECNSHWHSKAFKSRPAGRDIPPVDDRGLLFAFASDTNNKMCHACYLKNQRLRKRQRDEQQEEEQLLQDSSAKRIRMDENLDSDIALLLESDLPRTVLEREGIAVAVLCLLSQNASLKK